MDGKASADVDAAADTAHGLVDGVLPPRKASIRVRVSG